MKQCVIGIIGNVGPEVDETLQRYMREAAQAAGAKTDQDHPPIIVIKNPCIPDRSAAILHGGASPVPALLESCELLERCGVFIGALPSNTAQYFRDACQPQTAVYIPPLLQLTAESCAGHGAVGLLCTTATRTLSIYENALAQQGISTVYPPDDMQERCVQGAIYGTLPANGNHAERAGNGLKSGAHDVPFALLSDAVTAIRDAGARAVIMGCTEIPLLSARLQAAFPEMIFIDPMRVLADHCLRVRSRVNTGLDEGAICRAVSVADIKTEDDAVHYLLFKTRQYGR